MSQGEVSPSLPRLKEAVENLRRDLAILEQLAHQIPTEVDAFVDRHHLTPAHLQRAMAALEATQTQTDFLQELARQLAAFGTSSLVWLADADGRFRPWYAEGFPPERWSSCTPDEDPAFLQAVREGEAVEFRSASGAFPDWLADLVEEAESAVLLPVTFGDRCPAVFLVAGSRPLEVPSLIVVMSFARMLLQNRRLLALVGEEDAAFLSVERWPTPAAVPPEPSQSREVAKEAPAVEEPVPGSAEAGAESVAALSTVAPESLTTVEPKLEAEAAVEPAEEFSGPEPTSPEPERPREAAASEAAVVPDAREGPEREVPAGLEELHNEALRFARLLVAEIKLYNEAEVTAGRRSADLYRRLREDIDRSREMYEKRVDLVVQEQVDYLHEELVRILCGGDPSLLGPDYPGPVLRSEFCGA